MKRLLLLTVGPLVIVACAHWVTYGGRNPSDLPVMQQANQLIENIRGKSETETKQDNSEPVPSAVSLDKQCQQQASNICKQIGLDANCVIRAPFVIAGEIPESHLLDLYNDVVAPTAQALETAYFDRVPNQPITIAIFANDDGYRDFAQRVDNRPTAGYYGYYVRSKRRMVINIATGNGTLAHELTHALSHFDFEEMPEWLDEGIATLHEECEFTPDGLKLRGLPNWRLNELKQARNDGRMLRFELFMSADQVRHEARGVDYAHARYLCLYLQSRGVLSDFYRKYRTNFESDPYGHRAICQVLHVEGLEGVQSDFLAWLDRQER